MRGNAGAEGAIIALASDFAFALEGSVLNPHYKKSFVGNGEASTEVHSSRFRKTGSKNG